MKRFLIWSERIERWLTLAGFTVLVLVVFGDVLYRELFGTGLHWARQTGVYANIVVIMFGMGLTSATGQHLRPRFADSWLPEAWDSFLNRCQDGGMALFCMAFAWFAGEVVADSFTLAEQSAVLGIYIWPFQAIIPLAFALSACRHAVYAYRDDLKPLQISEPGAT